MTAHPHVDRANAMHEDYLYQQFMDGEWAGPIPEPTEPCPHCAKGIPVVVGDDDEGRAYWHVLERTPEGGVRTFAACTNRR